MRTRCLAVCSLLRQQQVTVPCASSYALAEAWGAGSVPVPPACVLAAVLCICR